MPWPPTAMESPPKYHTNRKERVTTRKVLHGILTRTGTAAVRQFLLRNLPPAPSGSLELPDVLLSKKPLLSRLLHGTAGQPKALRPYQYKMLFPAMGEPDIGLWDIPTMYALIRYMCDVMPPHWLGWERFPDKHDTQPVHDVIRIRFLHRAMFSETHGRIPEEKLNSYWSCLKSVLERLANYYGKSFSDEVLFGIQSLSRPTSTVVSSTRSSVPFAPRRLQSRPQSAGPQARTQGTAMASVIGTTDLQTAGTLDPQQHSSFLDLVRQGDTDFSSGQLDGAESHFASALRVVHRRDDAVSLTQQAACLEKLGLVHLQRARGTRHPRDYKTAVALYNAAVARGKELPARELMNKLIHCLDMALKAVAVEMAGARTQGAIDKLTYSADLPHKRTVQSLRNYAMERMQYLESRYTYTVSADQDPFRSLAEKQRGETVRILYRKMSDTIKRVVSAMVQECVTIQGKPPCPFAIVAFGSLAREEATPYTDLNLAVLLPESAEADSDHLSYFGKLVILLDLKMLNLGETVLSSIGIKSLNDAGSSNPLDDWFLDTVTKRGFCLGRWELSGREPVPITTPTRLAQFQIKESRCQPSDWTKITLVEGEQALVDAYEGSLNSHLSRYSNFGNKIPVLANDKACEEILELSRRFGSPVIDTDNETMIHDVARELQFLPSRMVAVLGLYYGVTYKNPWAIVDELGRRGVLRPNDVHHLKVAASIGAEVRLRTQFAAGGKKDAVRSLSQVCGRELIFRFYFTISPLQDMLHKFAQDMVSRRRSGPRQLNLSRTVLIDDSLRVRGNIHLKLLEYGAAEQSFSDMIHENVTDAGAMVDYGRTLLGVGNYTSAVSFFDRALSMMELMYGEGLITPIAIRALYYSAVAASDLGDYAVAMAYLDKALKIAGKLYGKDAPHVEVATIRQRLGEAQGKTGDHFAAMSQFQTSLEIRKYLHRNEGNHPAISKLIIALGETLTNCQQHEKAAACYEEALRMRRTLHGAPESHPSVAGALNNLGASLQSSGESIRAIECHEEALRIYRQLYGERCDHRAIADTLTHLGVALFGDQQSVKAVHTHTEALEMKRRIFGEEAQQESIAETLGHLARTYKAMGEEGKASEYTAQEYTMTRAVYGKAHGIGSNTFMTDDRSSTVSPDLEFDR
ncbi:hypothetical protein Bbelb_107570 [Branchiostoma belcheri]|nr:hypothetical protein Bbelb_107570 [Branchiostoma belcheri]